MNTNPHTPTRASESPEPRRIDLSLRPTRHGVTLRTIEPDELGPIVRIARQCLESPWSLREFILHADRGGLIVVASKGEKIVAYMLVIPQPINRADGHCDRVEIKTICVSPGHRREGTGTELVLLMQHEAEFSDRRLEAMVSERNLPGQLLLKSCGFRATGIASNDAGELAYVFGWRHDRQ